MNKTTEKDIATVLTSLSDRFDNDLYSKTEAQLEEYWFFTWEETHSLDWNIYNFNKALDLYRGRCRRWEEKHNGCCCVVERVRDKYLMPKIAQFSENILQKFVKNL